MNTKRELLNQLKIDRSEKEPKGRISIPVLLLLMTFSAAVGGVGAWTISRENKSSDRAGDGKGLALCALFVKIQDWDQQYRSIYRQNSSG